MSNKSILALMLLAACNAGDVVPGDVEKETDSDGGYGDSGDTEGSTSNPDECWENDAPAGAVRWQCEGLAEATVFATLNIEVPDWLDNADFLQLIIDTGRFDAQELFGPWDGEAYDDPGIDACCSPDIVGNGEEGEDETGADPTDGGGETIPQPAQACAHDCADQTCRAVSKTLRDLASQLPAGIPIAGPSYQHQLDDLANWVAGHQQDCWEALIADGVHEQFGAYIVDGEWQIPNSNQWPDVTELSIRGQCSVSNWYLPEDGEPQACTGLNDNNGEEPFGSGSSLDGFDTFAPTRAAMQLDGPLIADRDVMRFEIPAGKLEVLFAGEVHGVPVKVEVPNATTITGMVFPLFDGSHGIVMDPFAVEHHDAFGTWTMHVELGELVALDHAPRATFEVQDDGGTKRLDASASFDPDGDVLTFEWYRDGTKIDEGAVLEAETAADGSTLTLVVTDETGRTSWSNGLSADGT